VKDATIHKKDSPKQSQKIRLSLIFKQGNLEKSPNLKKTLNKVKKSLIREDTKKDRLVALKKNLTAFSQPPDVSKPPLNKAWPYSGYELINNWDNTLQHLSTKGKMSEEI
jgi:hypothetical protein